MKGGRTAPRNAGTDLKLYTDGPASMKGGRTAPRNRASDSDYSDRRRVLQ